MVTEIGNNKGLMVVVPSNEIVGAKNSANHHHTLKEQDLLILENKKALKVNLSGEKGSFIDFYI